MCIKKYTKQGQKMKKFNKTPNIPYFCIRVERVYKKITTLTLFEENL